MVEGELVLRHLEASSSGQVIALQFVAVHHMQVGQGPDGCFQVEVGLQV